MTNSEILKSTRDALTGKWTIAVVTCFLYVAISGVFAGVRELNIINLIIGGPLAFGATVFSLSIIRNEEATVEQLFVGFKQFGRTLIAYLLMTVYIILWMLLLIVPGIIKAMAYAQTFYIMADDDQINGEDAINKSMAMMDGYKTQYFLLNLRFLLLAILCIFTLGIGYLFLFPYMLVSYAKFYEMVKENYVEIPVSDTTASE